MFSVEEPEQFDGYRTSYSELDGDLRERMAQFLAATIGLSLNELGEPSLIGRMPLWWRIEKGAEVEFGFKVRVEFPDDRTVRLRCGRTIAEVGSGQTTINPG